MRYIAIRGEDRSWLIVDTMANPPRVLCQCKGWHCDSADFICKALNAYNAPLTKLMQEANVTITDVKIK